MSEGNVEPFPRGKNHFLGQLEGNTFVVWKGYSLGQYNCVLKQCVTNSWATSMQHICLGEMPFPKAHTTISLGKSKYLHKEKPYFGTISQGTVILPPWMKPIWHKDKD
jgi:hypothetical protein